MCTRPWVQYTVQQKERIEFRHLAYIFPHGGDTANIKYFQMAFFVNNQQPSQNYRIYYNQILFELK
jgi:hypothetical protein